MLELNKLPSRQVTNYRYLHSIFLLLRKGGGLDLDGLAVSCSCFYVPKSWRFTVGVILPGC